MSAVPVVLLVLAALAVFLGWAWLTARRSNTWEALARREGWQYANRDRSLPDRWQQGPFGAGGNRHAENVVSGRLHGRDVLIFDYRYSTTGKYSGGDPVTHAHRFGVVAIELGARLPQLSCGKHGVLLSAIATRLGVAVRPEWDQFDRTFRVDTSDPKYGLAMMHSQMMVHLMADRPGPWWIEDGWILSSVPENQSPDEALGRLEQLSDIVDLIPAYVWRDWGHVDPARLPRSVGPGGDRPSSY